MVAIRVWKQMHTSSRVFLVNSLLLWRVAQFLGHERGCGSLLENFSGGAYDFKWLLRAVPLQIAASVRDGVRLFIRDLATPTALQRLSALQRLTGRLEGESMGGC